MFNPSHPLLPNLDKEQIGWWDECHIEQQGGKVGNRIVQYSFKRDEQGNLSKDGEYSNNLLTKTSFKYPEQGRFSFGVAKVKKIGSEEAEGVRMPAINYTNKTLCTIDTFNKHMQEECKRITTLTGESHGTWVVNDRPVGEVWMNDPVSKMKGAGGKKGETLELAGIKSVSDIKAVLDDDLPALKDQCNGISLITLKKWRDAPAHDGTCPHQKVDFRKSANPYLAKYGAEEWRKECESSVFMK